MPVGQRLSENRGLYTLMEAVNLKSFFSFNELDCLKYLTGKRFETIKPHWGWSQLSNPDTWGEDTKGMGMGRGGGCALVELCQ